MRNLLIRAALAGMVFALTAAFTGLAGLFVLTQMAGYDPQYILDKTGEALTAKLRVSELDSRLRKVENALITSRAAVQPDEPAQSGRPEVGFEPQLSAPSRGAAPPLSAPPAAKFGGAAKVAEVNFTPTVAPPQFDGLDRPQLDVCQDGTCRFPSLAKAYTRASDGDVITIGPGLYSDCIDAIKKSVAIIGRPGPDGQRPTFSRACAGKAALILAAPEILVQGIQVQDIRVGDQNGACFRLQHPKHQRVLIRDVVCVNSQNGILGSPGSKGGVHIEQSLFAGNGVKGRAQGIYVTGGEEVVIRNSVVHSTKQGGHSIKVGARRLLIESSIIAALDQRNSRAIDFYGGGVLLVRDSVLQQGEKSDNHEFIGLAGEAKRLNLGTPHAVFVTGSWLIYDDSKRCCRWLLNGRKTGEILLQGNRLVNVNGSRIKEFTNTSNKDFGSRRAAGLPAYDGTLASLPLPQSWTN